jgi:hypothetical protein
MKTFSALAYEWKIRRYSTKWKFNDNFLAELNRRIPNTRIVFTQDDDNPNVIQIAIAVNDNDNDPQVPGLNQIESMLMTLEQEIDNAILQRDLLGMIE